MKQRSLKSSLFSSLGVLLVVLLCLNLFYTVFCLHQSDIAGEQSLLAQRILLGAVRQPRVEEIKQHQTVADSSERCGICEAGALPELNLLLQGGMLSGNNLPRIESGELVELLQSMRTHWRRVMESPSSETLRTPLFCRQARTLNDALMQRALEFKSRLWPPVWTALLLILALLVWLSLQRFFVYRKQSALADYSDNLLAGFEGQLLLALPVAFVLLDDSLTVRFVNHFGESYFGQFPVFDEVNFAEFCQDQALLEHLLSSFAKARPIPYEGLPGESGQIQLKTVGGHECQVFIQWYKLYLGGVDYLLGLICDPQEENLQGVLPDISQKQLQELSRKLFRVQDDERQHLADELHDGLCQSLAALKMQVFRVEKGIDDEENRDDCRKARQFIAQIIEDVRRLSHDLSPVILDDLGLGGALAHLVNNFAALNDLKVSISVPELEGCFASDAARHIYRIVQEAVNNVAKHAQASLLVLEAEVTDETVRFLVRDDGIGFGSDQAGGNRSGAGLGLASMAQRVRLLGGEFSVSTKPGEGAVVTFILPRKARI